MLFSPLEIYEPTYTASSLTTNNRARPLFSQQNCGSVINTYQ